MKPWSEVEVNPEFQALPESDKIRAQSEYFDDVVVPNLEPQDIEDAKSEFFTQFNRSYLPPDSGQGPAESAIAEGIQSLAKVGTGTVEGLGQFSSSFVRNWNPVGLAARAGVPGAQSLVDAYASIPEAIASGAGQAQEFVEETVPSNPLLADTMLQKGAGVAGQVTGQLASVLSGAAVTRAPKILQALGLGQAGLMGLESGYAAADQYGVTDPWQRDLMAASYAAAEVVPERMFGFGTPGFTRALIGEVRDVMGKGAVTRAAKTALGEGLEEPITGTAQALSANVFAEQDPERPGYSWNGERLPNIDPTSGEFWGARSEEAILGAFGGTIFAGAEFLGSRPRLDQAKAVKEKTQAAIEVLSTNPNPTAEDVSALEELKVQDQALNTHIAQQEQKFATQAPVVQAVDAAVQTAAQAGLPSTARALEQYKMAVAAQESPTLYATQSGYVSPDADAASVEASIKASEQERAELDAEAERMSQPFARQQPDIGPERTPDPFNPTPLAQETSALPAGRTEMAPEGPVSARTSMGAPAFQNAPQGTPEAKAAVVANARAVVDSQKATLPSAADAWVGTREELLADPAIRQVFITNERLIDPDLTEEQASTLYDVFMGNQSMDGVTFGGRTYIMADRVEVFPEDGTFEGAIQRLLRHEDTHIAIDTVTQTNPKRKKEWESLKKRVSPEKLDDLAKDRYRMFKDWRVNSKSFDSLVHEYFAAQMERDEAGQTVDDRPLLDQFIAFMKKVLARITGKEVSLEEIREFVRAGREARARKMQAETRSGARASLQKGSGVPAIPQGSAQLITHQSPYPGMTSEKIAEYAWPRFYASWTSNLEDPDAPLTSAQQAQLEAEWRANLADENAMEIAADNAFTEERRARMSMDVTDTGPFSTPPETGGMPIRFSMQPSYSSQSEERTEDYKEAVAAIPETGKDYVQFLGSLTRTPKEVQAVRPLVDFARSLMGSYQGDEIEVTAENTERVKELAAQAFQKGKPGAQFAEELSQQFRDSGFSDNGRHQGSVAAGVLQMEILDYAVRLAGAGDKSLALALMPYANDVAAADHASVSNAGRALQMRSMAGQQKGFWTILNSLAKGERELAEKSPIYKELREALFSDEVRDETAGAVQKDVESAEGQKAINPTESPEDLLDAYLGRALGIMDQAERDITIKLFNDLAELELLLTKQYEMQAPKGAKASMSAARNMNDPVAIQERIDQLKKSISGGLKALDQFKTSEATKEARTKALNKTPRAKKEISADAQAKKMLDRLENKEKRTKKEPAPWKKAFEAQVKNPKSDAEFATEMASHGLSMEISRKLFDEAAKATTEAQKRKTEAERRAADRKETQRATSEAKERVREQKREMDRPSKIADQKSFINEVVRQIFSGTLEEQSDPSWRRNVMVEAFKKEGFSQGSAENAADYLGASLDRNLKQAQEKAAQKAAKDLNMKKPTLEKLVKAIRSRAVDPLNADPVTKALAAEAGFAGITPEQFTELAKLDGQMRGPYQTIRAKAAARMLDIALAAKPPKSKMEILTQAWISSALSSISTMSLSGVHAAFIPVRRLVTDFAGIAMDVTTGKTKPADAAQLMVNTMGNMQQSAKYMLATAKFAGMNDAYTQHIVEFINQMHSMQADLQRAVQTIKDPKSTGIEKGKAAIKIAFTSTDIVRRILSTADETWGSMLQDFILRNEAMRTLVQKGRMTPTMAALVFTKASNDGRSAYDKHLAETGNEVEAQLVERDATQNALIQSIREIAGEGAAKDVEQTASLESPMELGNRRSEDAPLADVFNTGLEWVKQLAIATRRKNELAGRMITGFVTVPANILNRSAYFTPVGLIRALYKMGKIGGDPEKIRQAYEETMKTEGQQRMRLIEGIVGTMLITILMALRPDDDEEGMVITGSGPEDRGLREAWLKKGNRPNTIQWVDKKGNVRFSVPYARGGFDHLNLPFTLVGTMDDMKLKGIKPQPANVEWGTQYMHTALKGLFDQAKFFGLKNVASMPTQNLTDKSLASQAAYLAAPVLPWSGLTKSLGRMWTGPTDQSSVRSAVLAQLPLTNFFAGPALNALGDQRGPAPTDAAWDRALMSGVPWTVGAANKGPDADLYDFMIDKGVAPNVPLRSNIERKNGLITDSRWKEYLQYRGKLIKQGIRKNLREMKRLPYQDAQNMMEKLSGEATKAAKAKLKLE